MSVRRLNGSEFHDLAGQILLSGHRLRFRASGGSMQPFIHDDDILEVAPFVGERLRRGDVLLVEATDGRWLAHRVVKTGQHDNKFALLIKGDACPYPDGWFGLEDVLGRVLVVEHGSQRIDLKSPARQWRVRTWVAIAPWIPKLSWLPQRLRRHVRRLLLGGGFSD